jgi:hypothetical protein
MAGPTNPDKTALVAELATARSRLSETGSALRAALDVPSRAKESFKRHRPTWLGGAALLGLVLSKLPPRRSTVFVERATGKALGAAGKLGFAWTAAKFAFDLAKPLISELAGKRFGGIARKFGRPGEDTPDTGRDTHP